MPTLPPCAPPSASTAMLRGPNPPSISAPRAPASREPGARAPNSPPAPIVGSPRLDTNPGAMLLAAIEARDLPALSRALLLGAQGMPELGAAERSPLVQCARMGWIAGSALLLPPPGTPACRQGLLRAADEAHAAGHNELGRFIESRARKARAT